MTGLYLYGITFKSDQAINFPPGVEFGETLEFLNFKNISAIISRIDLRKISPDDISHRLKEDLSWMKENVKRHHAVIMDFPTVIPIRFGTIFKNKSDLENTLEKYYPRINHLLSFLENKEEWGVKIYLDKNKIEKLIENNPKFKKSNPAPYSTVKWYQEKKRQQIRENLAEEELERRMEKILNDLNCYAERVNFIESLLDHEKKERELILNLALLIKKEKKKELIERTSFLNQKLAPMGIILDLSGPWPPYNFVSDLTIKETYENNYQTPKVSHVSTTQQPSAFRKEGRFG